MPPDRAVADRARSGALANAVGDVVAGDVEGLVVLSDAAHEDVGVRVAGVVVIDRYPVEFRPEVHFHLLHQITGGLARVGQLRTVFGRDDEAELMAIVASPLQESATILAKVSAPRRRVGSVPAFSENAR